MGVTNWFKRKGKAAESLAAHKGKHKGKEAISWAASKGTRFTHKGKETISWAANKFKGKRFNHKGKAAESMTSLGESWSERQLKNERRAYQKLLEATKNNKAASSDVRWVRDAVASSLAGEAKILAAMIV